MTQRFEKVLPCCLKEENMPCHLGLYVAQQSSTFVLILFCIFFASGSMCEEFFYRFFGKKAEYAVRGF
jgi:hypothetical protein